MDRALGRRIVDQRRTAEQRGLRTGVDDAAALAQVRQHRARHVDIAGDVGLQGLLQVQIAQILEPVAMQLEGRIVDQDVDAAQRPVRLPRGLVAECRVTHVTADGNAAPALFLDRGARGPRILVLVQVQDRHVGTFAREQDGHCPADARIAPGYQCAHALQFAAAAVSGCLVAWRQLQFMLVARLVQVLCRHLRRLPADAGLDASIGGCGLARALPAGLCLQCALPRGGGVRACPGGLRAPLAGLRRGRGLPAAGCLPASSHGSCSLYGYGGYQAFMRPRGGRSVRNNGPRPRTRCHGRSPRIGNARSAAPWRGSRIRTNRRCR